MVDFFCLNQANFFKYLKDLNFEWNQLKCRHNEISHGIRGFLKFDHVICLEFVKKNFFLFFFNFLIFSKMQQSNCEKIENIKSDDRTKILNQYKYLVNIVFEFEFLKQKNEYLSKIAVNFLKLFTEFCMIPSDSKILM